MTLYDERERLSVTVHLGRECAVIELHGQLSATSGDLLVGVVEGKLHGAARDVVIDLTAVTDCDLAGAQALGRVRAHVATAGASLTLRGLPDDTTVAAPPMWFDGLLTRTNTHQ